MGCDWGCSGPNRLYGSAEYLLWWIKTAPVPPLITTGSASDPLPGAIGMPGTGILFGGSSIGGEARSGGRFTLGYWCDDCHDYGIEGSFFFLGQQSDRFSAASGGLPVLARPFFNALTGAEDAELVAFPNVLAGSVNASLTTRLMGAEANLRANLCRGCNYHTDLLFGFRYIGLDENLEINEALNTLRVPGGRILVSDRFDTRNRFYSGQIGLDTEIRHGRWFIDLKGKVALGSNHEVVKIGGNTVVNDPRFGTTSFNGGLLALSSNSGRFTRDMFVVAPEGTINIGYQVTDNLRAFVGYNFLYLSNVVRPGTQIDRVVNPNLIPTTGAPAPSLPVRPLFAIKGTDFWAQGINFGLEYRY